jgi:hypothetical protein
MVPSLVLRPLGNDTISERIDYVGERCDGFDETLGAAEAAIEVLAE